LIFFSWQFAVCTHGSVVQLALFDFFDIRGRFGRMLK